LLDSVHLTTAKKGLASVVERKPSANSPKAVLGKATSARRVHPVEWIATGAAVAAAFGAAASAWFIYQNNIVSQRAFVYVDSPIQLFVALDIKDRSKIVSFPVALTNSGNTATSDLSLLVRCADSGDPLPEPWVLLNQGSQEKVPQIIGPRQTVRSYCTFSLDKLNQIKDGKLHGYLMGEIAYKDRLASSTLHRTQLSWELLNININEPVLPPSPQSGATPAGQVPAGTDTLPNVWLNLVPKGQHNCADEDCP
jgi:hypothetical protein